MQHYLEYYGTIKLSIDGALISSLYSEAHTQYVAKRYTDLQMVFELEEKSAVLCVILLFGSSHINTTCNFEDILKLSSNKDRSHARYGKIEIISGKISNSELQWAQSFTSLLAAGRSTLRHKQSFFIQGRIMCKCFGNQASDWLTSQPIIGLVSN